MLQKHKLAITKYKEKRGQVNMGNNSKSFHKKDAKSLHDDTSHKCPTPKCQGITVKSDIRLIRI